MRSFVVSVIIILICFSVATANFIWTRSALNMLLDDFNDISTDGIESFLEKWNRTKAFLFYTTRSSLLRELEDEMQHLAACTEGGDEFELRAAKNSIIYKIKEICDSHSFKLKSIL